jgi:hypothetical protein
MNDLRPGDVLPDGAVVVSVGQPTAATDSNSEQALGDEYPSADQTASHNLLPVAPETTQSVLEAEQIPRPARAGSSNQPIDKPTTKKF